MRRVVLLCFVFVQFGLLLCSASTAIKTEAITNTSSISVSDSTTKADITTPLPTIPTEPNPSTASPIVNPATLNPDTTAPPTTTTTTPSPHSSGASWCVASQAASQMALQIALDYACGHGADCSPVQPGGTCYSPITVRDHASFAFNSYYQKNPVPNSCNFHNTAVITSTNPSYGTCQYPSTSTSSSVLDINASGSTIFGGGVPNPTSSAVITLSPSLVFQILLLIVAMAKN